jgi:MFS family permease
VLADKLGPRKAMGSGMVVAALALVAFALFPGQHTSMTFLIGYSLVMALGVYAYNAASLGFFMGLSNPAIGATHFAAYMAITNLTYAWTSPAGGYLADRWGTTTLFFVAAAVQVAALGLLPLVNPKLAADRYRAVGALQAVDGAPAG